MAIQRKFTGMLLLGSYTDIILCISIDFFFSLLFMSFGNSVFALFASIQGMCNIMRTFAMVRLGGSGSAMATVPAEKSVTYLYHLTCSVSRIAEEKTESK